MKRSIILSLAICLSFPLAAQKAPNSFRLEDVMSAAFPTNLTVSPTKSMVAWVQNKEGIRNIYLASGPEYQGKQLTNYSKDDGQEINSLIVDDSKNQIIFVYGGAPNRQGEIPNPTSDPDGAKRQIFSVNITSGKTQRLVDGFSPQLSPGGKWLAYIKGGSISIMDPSDTSKKSVISLTTRGRCSSPRWSPSGDRLAFVSHRREHSYIGVYNLSTKRIEYLDPSVDHDSSPAWSPTGDEIGFIRIPNEAEVLPFMPRRSALPWSIHVVNIKTGKAEQVWKARGGTGSAFRFVSARDQLMWGTDNQLIFPYEGDGWTHLYAVNRNTKKVTAYNKGDFEVQYVSISADGSRLLYSSNQEDIDRQHIWESNVITGKIRSVTSGTNLEWSPQVVPADNSLVYLSSGPTTPAHALIRKKGTGKALMLDPGAIPSTFPSGQLVTPRQVIITSADGMEIHGQLFMPNGIKKGEKHPALLFFHGGSRRQMLLGFHHRGYYHNAYAMNQYLVSHGYIVLAVNYRSGIGYGMKFREALNYGARGASEYNDVMGAGLYLKSLEEVDGSHIGLWGGSYGGFLTAMGLAKSSDLFAAGVDLHGVHDWNIVIKNFVPTYDAGKNAAASKLAFESSPLAYVSTWRSPVLLIQGDDDRNVPFTETIHMVESLRKQGVDVEQLIFPDEVHGFLMHKSWLAAYHAAADFFDRKLK